MGLPALGVGSVAYIATSTMMGDPKKAALNDLAKQRVKVSISCCSEWSYLPKAKNLVWALQDEFEEDKENIYYFTDTMNKEWFQNYPRRRDEPDFADFFVSFPTFDFFDFSIVVRSDSGRQAHCPCSHA